MVVDSENSQEELFQIPIQAPAHVRGKWSKTCYKIKEVTEGKVTMIEDIHTEYYGCLYRWRRVGISVQGKTNDPYSLLVHVQEGPTWDVFKVTENLHNSPGQFHRSVETEVFYWG